MEQKSQSLSSLISAPQQHLILIIDDTGREKVAQRILRQFHAEQSQDDSTLKILQLNERLKQPATLTRFLADCISHGQKGKPFNVLLPTLADLLCYQRPAVIFEFLHELRLCEGMQRCVVWASTPYLIFPKVDYLLAACEYLCDTKIHLLDEQKLNFITRKPGGGIAHKGFTYKLDKNEFLLQVSLAGGGAGDRKSLNPQQAANSNATNQVAQANAAEPSSTFKIELEEEELVARNAMKLPYEKTSDADASGGGGNIVYTPDASDDFDEEDPDEDLCI